MQNFFRRSKPPRIQPLSSALYRTDFDTQFTDNATGKHYASIDEALNALLTIPGDSVSYVDHHVKFKQLVTIEQTKTGRVTTEQRQDGKEITTTVKDQRGNVTTTKSSTL